MNQLGKNLIFTLCIVATLLIIIGLKRKFDGGKPALLSQPSEEYETNASPSAKSSPRPRVLQAKPITQHDRTILSPTGPQNLDTAFPLTRASDFPIAPIPSAIPSPANAPELVPATEQLTSPESTSADDDSLQVTSTVPVAAQPLPEFVLTDSEDSFWSISERVYGSGVYYRALFRHNEAKVLRPDQLRAGVEVRTPSLEVLREQYPDDFPVKPATTP